eukprot:Opistho-2@78793
MLRHTPRALVHSLIGANMQRATVLRAPGMCVGFSSYRILDRALSSFETATRTAPAGKLSIIYGGYSLRNMNATRFVSNEAKSTHSRNIAHGRCWNCDNSVARLAFACENCGKIQPPDESLNFFEMFRMPVTFNVDDKVLENQFKELQWQLHPDKHTMSTKEEQAFSALLSSKVNDAFKTIKSPLSRGLYILKLNGVSIEERDEKSASDPEFLMEIMEVSERLAEAEGDEEVHQIRTENSKKLSHTLGAITAAFETGDFGAAKEQVARLQFYENIHTAIRNWAPGQPLRVHH